VTVGGVAEADRFTQRRFEAVDGPQAWIGELEAARPWARRVVGVQLERRDRDLHPAVERQGTEESVELWFAVGTVQADGFVLSRCGGRSPEAYQMSLTGQVGGGGRFSAHTVLELSLWRVIGDGHVKSDKELHGLLLR
jgi:hypothetical protein